MPRATRPALWRRLQRRRVPALLVGIGLAVAALGVVAFEAETFRRLEFDSVDARFSIRGAADAARRPASSCWSTTAPSTALPRLRWPLPAQPPRAGDRRDRRATSRRRSRYDVAVHGADAPARGQRADHAASSGARRRGPRPRRRRTARAARGSSAATRCSRQIGARPGSHRTTGPTRAASSGASPWDVDGLQTFGIVAAEVASGKRIPPSALGGDGAWIDFAGPPGTVPAVSFVDVLRGDVAAAGASRTRSWSSAPPSPSLQDVHATSTSRDELMAGPEIQAQMAGDRARRLPARSDAPDWLSLLAIVGARAARRRSPACGCRRCAAPRSAVAAGRRLRVARAARLRARA